MKVIITILLLLFTFDIVTSKLHKRITSDNRQRRAFTVDPEYKPSSEHNGTYLTDAMGMSKDIKTTTGAGGCKYLKKSVCSTKSMENAQKDWKANMQNLTYRFWSSTRIAIAAAVLMDNMSNDAKTCKGTAKPAKTRRRLLATKLHVTDDKQQVPYVFAKIPACKESQKLKVGSTGQPLPCEWNLDTKCRPAFENSFLRVQTLAGMSVHSITNQAESCAKNLLKMKASMICNSCNDAVDGEYLKGKWQTYKIALTDTAKDVMKYCSEYLSTFSLYKEMMIELLRYAEKIKRTAETSKALTDLYAITTEQ